MPKPPRNGCVPQLSPIVRLNSTHLLQLSFQHDTDAVVLPQNTSCRNGKPTFYLRVTRVNSDWSCSHTFPLTPDCGNTASVVGKVLCSMASDVMGIFRTITPFNKPTVSEWRNVPGEWGLPQALWHVTCCRMVSLGLGRTAYLHGD